MNLVQAGIAGMRQDLVNAAAKRPDNLGLRRLMTREAPDTFRWLMEFGVEFIGPNPEPPHTRPRMHNIVPGTAALIFYLGIDDTGQPGKSGSG